MAQCLLDVQCVWVQFLSVSYYIYIHIYMCVCVYVCMHMQARYVLLFNNTMDVLALDVCLKGKPCG